jgi:hypothetical protein
VAGHVHEITRVEDDRFTFTIRGGPLAKSPLRPAGGSTSTMPPPLADCMPTVASRPVRTNVRITLGHVSEPDFEFTELLPLGPDETDYRPLPGSGGGVSTIEAAGRRFLQVVPPVKRVSSVTSMTDSRGGGKERAARSVVNSASARIRPCRGGSSTSIPSGGTLRRVLDSTAAGSEASRSYSAGDR